MGWVNPNNFSLLNKMVVHKEIGVMEIQRLRDYGIKELRNERFQVSGVGCKKLHSAESRAQSVHAISFLYAPCSMLSALCSVLYLDAKEISNEKGQPFS